mmetsp:Transcript_78901/g.231581  ORF Transcript_78901/g.231581 Transcript_78901/m.231581 type:complete len:273 (-) Transcript_78901:212-1030(-)
MSSPKRSSPITSFPSASSAKSAPGSAALPAPRPAARRRSSSSARRTASACRLRRRSEREAATALPCWESDRQRDCKRLNSMPGLDVRDGALTSASSLCAASTGSKASAACRCRGSSSSTASSATADAAELTAATFSSASCTMPATSLMICPMRDCLSSVALAWTLSSFSFAVCSRPRVVCSSRCSRPCASDSLKVICVMVDLACACRVERVFSSSAGGFLSLGHARDRPVSFSAPSSADATLLEISASDLSTSSFSSCSRTNFWRLLRSSSK